MSAEVVSLSARRALSAHPALVQVDAYWEGLRAGRQMPSRAEVDPRGLQGVLPNCFILERVAPGMARFRVAGRLLAEVMGIELVGMPISVAFDMASREILEETLERIFTGQETVRMTVSARLGIGRGRIEGQLLLLPLRDDLGHATRILGALAVTEGDASLRRHPRRLTIEAVAPRDIPLRIQRPVRPPQSAGAPVAEVVPLFAE